jgi:hypothetical protein
MSLNVAYTEADVCSFVEALGQLSDDRDNRGKRHAFAFVVAAVVLAILSGRSNVSSIFRYIRNRLEWLQEVASEDQPSRNFPRPARSHAPICHGSWPA